MILKRYINREILRTSVAILTILILIFISSRFIKYIQLAVDGTISSGAVFSLVGLQVPAITGFLLPLSFFIAVLMVLGRLYSESEMAVIKSVGVGDSDLAKNILPVAIFLAVTASILSFWLNPWANYEAKKLRAEERAEARFGAFSPGRFQENSAKNGVLFVESKTDDGEIRDLFVVSGIGPESTQLEIKVAASGRLWKGSDIENNPADTGSDELDIKEKNFIVLQDGVNYSLDLLKNRWSLTEYESYFMQTEKEAVGEIELPTKSLSTIELFKLSGPDEWAEIHWRLSAPISILILCYMAVPLARTQPRKGKFSRLFPAIMVYMVYALLLMNSRKLIETGKIPELLGFWWIHGLALLFTVWSFRNIRRNKKHNKKSNNKANEMLNNQGKE